MSLLEPVALAGLAVLPILVLLWLMRRRRPEIRVSAAFLWEQAAREARVDSFARRLQAHLLLLLQLLLAALLTLSLARPWLQIPSSSAAEVAILIDTSASMGAELDGSTRFEKARTQARRLLHRAPPGAQVLLAGYDRTARILVPFSRDRSAALRALDRLSPREVAGDSQVGLALAASLLASRPLAEAFLLGDRPPRPPLPSRLRFLDCGGPASNVGLVALRAARGRAGTFPLVVGLRNYTDRPQQRELELRRGGLLVASRRIGLPAGGRQVAHFTLTATGSEEVEARLVGGDALATDDRAWTVLPRAASVAGRAVGVGNLFAEQALLAVPGVRLERAVGAAGADLVLWEQEAPWPLPEGTHILLAVPTPLGRGEPREGPFALQAEESTLTRGVPLNDLAVAGVRPLEIPPGAEVLARAGPHPALVRVRQGSTTALLFCFDLYRSELPLWPALPLPPASRPARAAPSPRPRLRAKPPGPRAIAEVHRERPLPAPPRARSVSPERPPLRIGPGTRRRPGRRVVAPARSPGPPLPSASVQPAQGLGSVAFGPGPTASRTGRPVGPPDKVPGAGGESAAGSPGAGSEDAAARSGASSAAGPVEGGADGTGEGPSGPPSLTFEAPPDYPAEAAREGVQGIVRIRAHIDTQGRVTQAEVVGTSGDARLDEAARQAALAWRFRPALRGGIPVVARVVRNVRFALDG